MEFSSLVVIIVLLWIFFYTVSYGVWTWKRENTPGAIMVFFIAISSLVLPIYTLFFVK